MAKECPECGQKPCMGGGGVGSCIGGKSKTAGERGKKAPPPQDTPEHKHDYRMSRVISGETVKEGKKTYSIRTSEYQCHNRTGKCDRPTMIDVKRIRLYL